MLDMNYEIIIVSNRKHRVIFTGSDKNTFFEFLAEDLLKICNKELSVENIEKFKLYVEALRKYNRY